MLFPRAPEPVGLSLAVPFTSLSFAGTLSGTPCMCVRTHPELPPPVPFQVQGVGSRGWRDVTTFFSGRAEDPSDRYAGSLGLFHKASGRRSASPLRDRHVIPQGHGGHSSPQNRRDTSPVVTAAAQGREGGGRLERRGTSADPCLRLGGWGRRGRLSDPVPSLTVCSGLASWPVCWKPGRPGFPFFSRRVGGAGRPAVVGAAPGWWHVPCAHGHGPHVFLTRLLVVQAAWLRSSGYSSAEGLCGAPSVSTARGGPTHSGLPFSLSRCRKPALYFFLHNELLLGWG